MNKKICEKILNNVKPISEITKFIFSDDFTEDRQSYMVVVGITDETQVYPNLPDFEFKLSIVVDTFILDDDKGEIAHLITNKIKQVFAPYIYKELQLSELFQQLPVVGFLYNGETHTITAESNRYELNYLVYTSQ